MGVATEEPLFFAGDAVHQARRGTVVAALATQQLDGLLLNHAAARSITGCSANSSTPVAGGRT